MNTKVSDAVMVYFKRKGSASEDRIPAISVESCCVDPELITRVLPLHLAADAVPVARLPDYVRSAISGLAHIAMKDAPQVAMLHVGVIDNWLNSTHPQPAALDEVSGNSGELGGDERARFEAWLCGTSGYKACAKRGKIMSFRKNFDGSYADYRVNDRWLAWQAALAATGKQQGGEVKAFELSAETKDCLQELLDSSWREEDQHAASQIERLLMGPIYLAPPSPGIALSPIATRKLADLAAQGYVTNGVAIFNPATGHRGLVDNLGFVGWMGAQGIDLGQFRKAVELWRRERARMAACNNVYIPELESSPASDVKEADRLLALIDSQPTLANVTPPRDLRTQLHRETKDSTNG